MDWKIDEAGFQDASLYFGDCQVEDLVEGAETETGARRPEVLFALLCIVEDSAHECGLPGPIFLVAAALNRDEFRDKVAASERMTRDLQQILRSRKQAGDR